MIEHSDILSEKSAEVIINLIQELNDLHAADIGARVVDMWSSYISYQIAAVLRYCQFHVNTTISESQHSVDCGYVAARAAKLLHRRCWRKTVVQ